MPVTDAIAIRYTKEVLRPACDLLAGALSLLDSIQVDRRPDAKNLDALFPVGGGPVEDGRAAEGITPVSADQVRALFRLCEVIRGMADDDRDPTTGASTGLTSRALIHAFAVNPRTR